MMKDIDKIFERNVPKVRGILAKRTAAIAGCGGLGSNAAVALARAGIGNLVIADPDIVELSNLNRQYYFLDDVGKRKTDALTSHLLNINPVLKVESHFIELTKENVYELFRRLTKQKAKHGLSKPGALISRAGLLFAAVGFPGTEIPPH
jgi:hypothetical protein